MFSNFKNVLSNVSNAFSPNSNPPRSTPLSSPNNSQVLNNHSIENDQQTNPSILYHNRHLNHRSFEHGGHTSQPQPKNTPSNPDHRSSTENVFHDAIPNSAPPPPVNISDTTERINTLPMEGFSSDSCHPPLSQENIRPARVAPNAKGISNPQTPLVVGTLASQPKRPPNPASAIITRSARNSVDQYKDQETVMGKINHLKSIVLELEHIQNQSCFVKDGPPLIEKLSEQTSQLSQYLLMAHTHGLYQKDLLYFAEMASNFRTLLSEMGEPKERSRSFSDSQVLSPAKSKSPLTNPEPPSTLPPSTYDEEEQCHGFRTDEVVVERLFERFSSLEAEIENRFDIISSESNIIKTDFSSLRRELGNLQRLVSQYQTEVHSVKDSYRTNLSALQNRMQTLEAQPVPNEVKQLRLEVAGLTQKVTSSSSHLLKASLKAMINDRLATFKQEIISEISANPTSFPNPTSTNTSLNEVKQSLVVETNRLNTLIDAHTALRSEFRTFLETSMNLPTPNTSPSLSAEGGIKFYTKTLQDSLTKITTLISKNYSTRSELYDIKNAHTTNSPKISKLCDLVHKTLADLAKANALPDDHHSNALSILNEADEWMQNVESLLHTLELPAFEDGRSPYKEEIPTFAASATLNIYEFLDLFESSPCRVLASKKKASKLYKEHLSDNIKSQCLTISTNYDELRNHLVTSFGQLSYIINQMVTSLESTKKPSAGDIPARLSYFSAISHLLFRIDQLPSLSGYDSETVLAHVSSLMCFQKLLNVLPESEEQEFIEKSRDKGLNTTQLQGRFALELYRELVRAKIEDLQRLKDKRSFKTPSLTAPKQKTPHINLCDAAQEPTPVTTVASKPVDQWFKSGLSFPCNLEGHIHEIGQCEEWLRMSPADRREFAKKSQRRLCWSCLKPHSVCNRRCIQDSRVSDTIKCQGCVPFAKGKNTAPLSVFFCKNPDHNPSRPDAETLFKELKKYLKVMSNSVDKDTIVFANVSQIQKDPLKPSSSKSKISPPHSKVPWFDTKTGIIEASEPPSNFPSWNDACLLMQTIRVGSSECLVLFDRGANVNLIDGKLAEEEDLYVASRDPTTIKVAGAGSMPTEYGKYFLTLGSSNTGWYRIECHGVPNVTVPFPKFDLREANKEFRTIWDKSTPLPPSIGGSPVGLLIGLQNITMDPVLIGILPSGLGVYRSVFTDIYGSNICFGGPHPSFSKASRPPDSSYASTSLFINQMALFQDEIHQHPLLFDLENTPCSFEPESMDALPLSKSILLNDEVDPPTVDYSCLEYHLCINKALIPISKMRELVDQDDISDVITYRCPDCSKCLTCKRSSKLNATSLQDSVEQLAIEKSIHINLETCEVWVDLPFIKDPVKFLYNRHHADNNYEQALRVYKSQCRKPEHIKNGIRKVHSDLVAQGFIKALKNFPQKDQQAILNAPFKHYFPYRSVCKDDSISTPVRLVVDPTMTGLNLCLPKGENKITRLFDVLLRLRANRFIWTTDIKKMYNQLKVKQSSLPYQLMLFHDALDGTIPPSIWVLTSAWYGVVNTGNQAAAAIESLTNTFRECFPDAVVPLTQSRYVDDVASGAATEEERDSQISHTKQVLAKGGFSLKYLVKSGVPPDEAASVDGATIKLLGYDYQTVPDLLSLASPDSTNSKPNSLFTKRILTSIISSLFDPLGIYEPIKLQLKLHLAELSPYEWDEVLDNTLQLHWQVVLTILDNATSTPIPRYIGPPDTLTSPIRLICMSDAGEKAGGVAIYAGLPLPSGKFSCRLLTAKSKLMDATVPRNELNAIMLMAELAFITKRALGNSVKEIIYLTDSSIAMAWCHNPTIKLRLYVHKRVETIRRLIEWTLDSESIPLFHISSENNLADLVSKHHNINFSNVDASSSWQSGLSWMSDPFEQLPITPYNKLNVSPTLKPLISQECYDDPFFLVHLAHSKQLALDAVQENPESLTPVPVPSSTNQRPLFFIDLIGLGWFRARRRLARVLIAWEKWTHKALHLIIKNNDCHICQTQTPSKDPILSQRVDNVLFRHETKIIKTFVSPSRLNRFSERDSILYYPSRLSSDNPFRFQDLDDIPFLDATEFADPIPVVFSDSDIFFSFLIAVHMKIKPHSGNSATTREVFKRMFVPDNPHRIIQKLRADCSKCRLIVKKTVELEMQKHSFARTHIAPMFCNCMMDIAFGFPAQAFKNARKKFEVYALVVVCILTGGTAIWTLEGLETQDVVSALLRHSDRHGAPDHIFVDNGSQLKALEGATFSVRDLNAELYEARSISVSVSNPKAHEERGRVERKIGLIRSTLQKIVDLPNPPLQTALQWETLFATIANSLDNLPIARGNSNKSSLGYEILTANRLKLGRNNNQSLAGMGIEVDLAPNPGRLLARNRRIFFEWYQLFIDEIHHLILRPPKWFSSERLPVLGDIVLFVYNDSQYSKHSKQWKLGKVTETSRRSVTIMYSPTTSKRHSVAPRSVTRNPRDITIIFSLEELYPNSKEYFHAVTSKDEQNTP